MEEVYEERSALSAIQDQRTSNGDSAIRTAINIYLFVWNTVMKLVRAKMI